MLQPVKTRKKNQRDDYIDKRTILTWILFSFHRIYFNKRLHIRNELRIQNSTNKITTKHIHQINNKNELNPQQR